VEDVTFVRCEVRRRVEQILVLYYWRSTRSKRFGFLLPLHTSFALWFTQERANCACAPNDWCKTPSRSPRRSASWLLGATAIRVSHLAR
jgi:hypothetical protein